MKHINHLVYNKSESDDEWLDNIHSFDEFNVFNLETSSIMKELYYNVFEKYSDNHLSYLGKDRESIYIYYTNIVRCYTGLYSTIEDNK